MKKKSIILAIFTLLLSSTTIFAQMLGTADSKKIEHPFNPLPYDYDALEKAIDSETMNIHYNKHFRGYYDKFLKAIEGTALASKTLEEIFASVSKENTAVRNNAGGYYNHDLYWQIMSPNGGGNPSGALAKAIDENFGSFENFKTEFEKAAATRFGSGWAWLSVSKDGKLFISSTPNQDNPLMDVVEQQGTPIFALDVWEHAYYLKYQNKRTSYIGKFWEIVNWPEVEKRYNNLRK